MSPKKGPFLVYLFLKGLLSKLRVPFHQCPSLMALLIWSISRGDAVQIASTYLGCGFRVDRVGLFEFVVWIFAGPSVSTIFRASPESAESLSLFTFGSVLFWSASEPDAPEILSSRTWGFWVGRPSLGLWASGAPSLRWATLHEAQTIRLQTQRIIGFYP